MSFILEALRKSENERQRKDGPSLAAVRVIRRADSKPAWALMFGALLTVNVLVLVLIFAWPGPPSPGPAPRVPETRQLLTPAPPQPAPAQSAPRPRVATQPVVRAPAPQTAVAQPRTLVPEPAPVAAPAQAPAQPEVRPLETEIAAPAPEPALQSPPERVSAVVAEPAVRESVLMEPTLQPEPEELPDINDMLATGMLSGLPRLHMDIHVYSDDPADRFVFINMRKYREGEETREGPWVEEITPNGVVLNHRRLRFLLRRE